MTLQDQLSAVLVQADQALASAQADAAAQRQLAQRQADQISALEAQLAVSVSSRMLLGACPPRGVHDGMQLSDAMSVVNKYGSAGKVVRQFRGKNGFDKPTAISGILVHTSYKVTDVAGVESGKYDAAITTAAQAANDGDVLTWWHEPENDGLDRAQFLKGTSHFAQVVHAANPKIKVCQVLTGWAFNPGSPTNPEDWLVDELDLIGADLDGILPKGTAYTTSFPDDIEVCAALAEKHGIGWCVPEFGSRLASDGDYNRRAVFYADIAGRCAQAGSEYVAIFDYDAKGSAAPPYFTGDPEVTVWKAIS